MITFNPLLRTILCVTSTNKITLFQFAVLVSSLPNGNAKLHIRHCINNIQLPISKHIDSKESLRQTPSPECDWSTWKHMSA